MQTDNTNYSKNSFKLIKALMINEMYLFQNTVLCIITREADTVVNFG